MNLPQNKNVQNLIKTMDLDAPQHYFVVDKYELVDDDIVIKSIKVLDSNGNFLRFAKNNKVVDYLSKYPTAFSKRNGG